MYCKTVKK